MRLLKSSSSWNTRVATAFWLFGLINNVLYVIILAAAVDLVPSEVPKGIVLLADCFPAFVVKLLAPYGIHYFSYTVRVYTCVALSACGMLLIAYTPVVAVKLVGVGMASMSSGLGEVTFLGLTHFFGRLSLAGWGSGTGAAGLLGAGAYAFATSTLRFSSRATITASSILPAIMMLCYLLILPRPDTKGDYAKIGDNLSASDTDSAEDGTGPFQDDGVPASFSAEDSITASTHPSTSGSQAGPDRGALLASLRANAARASQLVYPYMIPMFIVYISEYIATTGVAPTLFFPLSSTPFFKLRDFYPAYSAIYQTGVFVSRSSVLFFRLKNIYTPSLLQVVNLLVLTMHAFFYFIPSVWIVFAFYFWAGLLGGGVYVNTFAKITEEVDEEDTEFSLSATTVADSSGILIASLISMALEPAICDYQASHGRRWCKEV